MTAFVADDGPGTDARELWFAKHASWMLFGSCRYPARQRNPRPAAAERVSHPAAVWRVWRRHARLLHEPNDMNKARSADRGSRASSDHWWPLSATKARSSSFSAHCTPNLKAIKILVVTHFDFLNFGQLSYKQQGHKLRTFAIKIFSSFDKKTGPLLIVLVGFGNQATFGLAVLSSLVVFRN